MAGFKLMRVAVAGTGIGLGLGPLSTASAATTQPTACATFFGTNPDVLRIVQGYAQGSARNPNMSAEATVNFIASTITQEVRRESHGDNFTRHASLYYDCLGKVDRSTIANFWPNLNGVIVEKERREALEAEAQRKQMGAQKQREQAAQAEQLEKARKQAETDALPANRLGRAYRIYIAVKRCFDARDGYAAVYINDEQAQKAKAWVIGIEGTLTKQDPSINSDAIWKQANGPDTTIPTNDFAKIVQFADQVKLQQLSSEWSDDADSVCGRSYEALSDLYLSINSEARAIKKDF